MARLFTSMVKKETLHLVRDFRTMLVALIMPLVLLLLFGFAVSMEVNNVRVVVTLDRHTDHTRQVIEQLRSNPYFTFEGVVSAAEVEPLLRAGKADAALTFRHSDGDAPTHQILVDATNPTGAQAAAAYVQSVVAGSSDGPTIISNTLYNPQLKSAYNFVPGIMGMIFLLICAMMTSVSIVSEKERGTMDLLLVSPARPWAIVLGKIVPYFVLSCVILALMLTLSYAVLGMPFSASVVNVVWISLIYVVLSLSFGLFVSTVASSQVEALIVSGVIFLLPVVMLSGMIFPIDNMPMALQWLSCVVPARWYIDALRVVLIQQLPASAVATEVSILVGMTIAMIIFAIKKFNSQT